ncbi:MAG: hypothetical protein DCC68_11470 [Planctomycetota bacterium]|nr:MAG: hypothetical protein DCC68_11470 [Planctomycetota bacterium]
MTDRPEDSRRKDAGAGLPGQASPRGRHRARVGKRTAARIRELRAKAPWLGLRKIAKAFRLTLHQVRSLVDGDVLPPRPAKAWRCPTCGAKLTLERCVRCDGERDAGRGARD